MVDFLVRFFRLEKKLVFSEKVYIFVGFSICELMDKKKAAAPLVCHGHSRPVVDLFYSPITPDGFFIISASKGNFI